MDALTVREADLAMKRRLGGSEEHILNAQNNLADTYLALGRNEEALSMRRDVYSGRLNLNGEEHGNTLLAANNYADSLNSLKRFKEAKALFRKTLPMARRVLGECHDTTLRMRSNYAEALCTDDGATLDDVREAVTTLEDGERIARRVLGGAHPTTVNFEQNLRHVRAALRSRDGRVSAIREGVEAMAA